MGYFENVLNENEGGNHKHLSAMLGLAKVLEKQKKYDECIEIISEITVCFPAFLQAVIEKAKIHIYNGEWDQATECISNVLMSDRNNVEALRIYVFIIMARENDDELVLSKMDELIQAMRTVEGKNSDMFYNISRLFARYCGRKELVLKKTQQMLDYATTIQPDNAFYLTEVGFQKSISGDFQTAYQLYLKASQLDGNNYQPLYGMIYSRIRQEQYDDAVQQLEFVTENLGSSQKAPDHCFLEAMLEWRVKGNKTGAISLLDNSLNLHIQQTKQSTSNLDFYIKLNADFLMTLAQEYLVHCGSKPKITSGGPPKHLVKAIKLLENVTKQNSAITQA